MAYEARTFFGEDEKDDIKGFTVLTESDGRYHIAEKWLATDENKASEDKWMDYWIPADELERRHDEGLCEPKGKLTDRQFEKVCEKVGWTDYAEEAAEA